MPDAISKRLIDANEFWSRLQNVVYDIFSVHEKDGKLTGTVSVGYYTETIQEVIKQTKTVDAVEVVHGRWIGTQYDGYADGGPVYDLWECSECREEYESEGDPPPYNFCPNCGADMREEQITLSLIYQVAPAMKNIVEEACSHSDGDIFERQYAYSDAKRKAGCLCGWGAINPRIRNRAAWECFVDYLVERLRLGSTPTSHIKGRW